MTIAVIWQEDNFQWCAADTRLVVGNDSDPITDIAAKIYTIPVMTMTLATNNSNPQVSYLKQYGFVYAGSALPATMTAITASTLLQSLAHPDKSMRPTFEDIAGFVHRLAERFMKDRHRFGGDGMFSAGFFGWCPHAMDYKVAHIDGRNDSGSCRVELSYPLRPQTDGEPWLVLGSAASKFNSEFKDYRDKFSRKRTPRLVIQNMIEKEIDRSVGGATSIGAANTFGFELYWTLEPSAGRQSPPCRIFNGLDLDVDLAPVGQYFIGSKGLA